MASKAPAIREETRIPRVRTSVSLPEDVLDWLKWRSASSRASVSGLIADAVRREAIRLAQEETRAGD